MAEKVKVERLWQLYLLITLSLDRKPGENGELPAPLIHSSTRPGLYQIVHERIWQLSNRG